MSKQKIIKELEKLNFKDLPSLIEQIRNLKSEKDILYTSNIIVFQSSSINHNQRLSLLKKINTLSEKYDLPFCIAHNLTLVIKLSKELGLQKNLIRDSHKSIELWKKILDEPLAINGLIFSYTDLALLFSDSNLNSLSLKYLDKARSLLSECENDYRPLSKLYVAYAVVYNRMNNSKKTDYYYNQIIEIAESKKDSMTLIPILINTSTNFLQKKKL